MSTETEITEEKKENVAPPDTPLEENQYKIFDYFKEHTGLLVTCVSALVAIMSCILHFAVGRMNYAFLAYWDISTLHANISNQSEFYIVACALLYILSIMLIHGLLSKTSDIFQFYCECLLITNRCIKMSKKRTQIVKKDLNSISKELKQFSPEEKKLDKWKEIKERIDQYYEILGKSLQSIKSTKKTRLLVIIKVTIQIIFAVILSYLMGNLFSFLVNITSTFGESIRLSRTVLFIIVFDLFGYFLPAFVVSLRASKKYKNDDVFERALELTNSEFPKFPFENTKHWKIKNIFRDRTLKSASVLLTVSMLCVLLISSSIGNITATQQKRFPIYCDGSTSYAIVYFSNATVIMEEASVQDETIVIDTTKQRILTTDDLSYNTRVFTNVELIRNEKESDADKKENEVAEDVAQAIGSFFERIKTRIGEVVVENEGSIPGT